MATQKREPGESTVKGYSDEDHDNVLHLNFDHSPDHRALFTLAEVEAAYARIMNASEAAEAAWETMDPSHPIVPGRPASFSDGVLDLLAGLSDDVARRVRIARGQR